MGYNQKKNNFKFYHTKKTLNSITDKEKEELVNKWIGSIKEYGGGHIELTENETAYIDTKIIKYCINPTGMPFEGLNEKKPTYWNEFRLL